VDLIGRHIRLRATAVRTTFSVAPESSSTPLACATRRGHPSQGTSLPRPEHELGRDGLTLVRRQNLHHPVRRANAAARGPDQVG
jgi:hypothetical protein